MTKVLDKNTVMGVRATDKKLLAAEELAEKVNELGWMIEAVDALTDSILSNILACEKVSGRKGEHGPSDGLAWMMGELRVKVAAAVQLADIIETGR